MAVFWGKRFGQFQYLKFMRATEALRVPLSYLLYEEKADMPKVEQIRKILEGERRESNFILQ